MDNYSILCIDDNQNNLYTLESLLASMKTTKVFLAGSGSQGLEILLKESVDLILLDVQMPEMDGFTVAKFIKKNQKTAHIPIIFISAVLTSDEFIQLGYRTGAIDYLSKPIDDNQLLNKISFYLKLFKKEKELEYERNRLQKIIDLQDNLVVVLDRKSILQVNQSFLDFVRYTTLKGFLKSHNCICDLFINEEGYLFCDKEKSWIDQILKDGENSIAIMPFQEKNRYFIVRVNVLDVQKEQFVATFTDITYLQQENIEFEQEAQRDPLTNVFNRRKLDVELKRLLYISRKYRLGFSLLMIDIDHFKTINDTYGHQVGDKVLQELTKRIVSNVREGDIFARYGGEEFTLVLSKSSLMDGLGKAYNIRKLVEQEDFDGVGKVTVSIGVASLRDEDDSNTIIQRADEGLYEAKKNGRNRVETVEA